MRGGLIVVLLLAAVACRQPPPTTPAPAAPAGPTTRDAGTMVGILARFKPLPGKEEAALAMFRELAEATKASEPDTVVYLFFRGRADPQEIIVFEAYTNADTRKAHTETPTIAAARAKLPGLVDMTTFKVEPVDGPAFGFVR